MVEAKLTGKRSMIQLNPNSRLHVQIEDSFTKIAQVEQGKPCRMQITDTAGVEQMVSLRESVIRESSAFLLVFALDNPSTYHDLMPIMEDIKRIKDTNDVKRIPILLCGNKVDLGFEIVKPDLLGTGMFPADFKPTGALQGLSYLETSAKLEIGVEKAFMDLAKMYIDARKHRKRRHRERSRKGSKSKCILM
ncbi:hypothetical protein E3P77_02609 [Wallemia ichthyophaga]|uniref:Uncharacterized protein n=1 Tax=Wallemia ichthyophaga TaxID=245174 RepID=A0A4T0L985_WALIC|nr:hypothetical protein E3P86_03653 [Wallemia ichthyophaga]TIB65737.1 hypothetical protein E3P77_02609 [Wallemia ichthyophaga]